MTTTPTENAEHDDPLDRYMDAFGARLEDAAAAAPTATPRTRRRRRLPRPALLAATATSLALALTALLLLLPGSDTARRLDVVAEARAALTSPDGAITHLIYRQSIEPAPDPGPKGLHVTVLPVTTEQWSAADPARWRATWIEPSAVVRHGGERAEIAFADGTESLYYPKRNLLSRTHGLTDGHVADLYPLGADPVATLRGMLARGELRDAGPARSGDRDVRRLVGTTHRTFGKRRATGTVQYDVDPTTYAPVRARIHPPLLLAPDDLVVILDFLRFERLPMTDANARLLTITTRPGVKIRDRQAKAPRRR